MPFLHALDRIRRWRRLGRCFTALLAAATLAGTVTLACGLVDAWWGLESHPRSLLTATALATVAFTACALAVIACKLPRSQGATYADLLLQSPRNPAAAALTLSESSGDTPFSRHLSHRAREAAAAELDTLTARRIIDWKSIVRAGASLALVASILATLAVTRPDATRVITLRLLHPAADLPPWSPLQFQIEPSHPAAIYGGELTTNAEITGASLDFPVDLLVRRPGATEITRLPSYRESPTRFSRKLDSVTEPVSIAFACGKARSPWVAVELLLQPKILAGKSTVTAPAYLAATPVQAPLDSNELTAIEGSEITLELTSNRPLAPSALIFTPANSTRTPPAIEEIPGEIRATNTIVFHWTATRPGKLSALLRDIRGTPAANPLELSFRALPDQAPTVELSSPPKLVMATPASIVPLAGRAEDDHALAKVGFVRTLTGFRDRTCPLASALHDKSYDFSGTLDLHSLGVSPGQTIELFLEASDHNPSLLGQGASEISQIRIISEADYATILRTKTTLAQFSARFAALDHALQQARESLEALDRAKLPAEAENARLSAVEAHRQAAATLSRLAADFPAFNIENRVKDLAGKAAGDLQENLADLSSLAPDQNPRNPKDTIRRMLNRIAAHKAEHQTLQQNAKQLADVGGILEMAARFRQIHANQTSITKRLYSISVEIEKGIDQNRRQLPALAETQEKIRDSLNEFATTLKERAEALQDPALAGLRESSLAFLQALATADPQSVMTGGARSGRLGSANDAYVQAELARSLLENLMKKEHNEFADSCSGRCMRFAPSPPDLNQTLEQLLQAMFCQNPGASPNPGLGDGGMGRGGTGPTGTPQSGYGMDDIPVIGPPRMTFEPISLGQPGNGQGPSKSAKHPDVAAESENLKPGDQTHATESAPNPESIPEPYREAVKRYFTPESSP